MREPLKTRVLLLLTAGIIIMTITASVSCSTAVRQKASRDQEMIARLEIEEKMNKIVQEEQTRSSNIRKLRQDVEEERALHQQTKEALVREQLRSQSLREDVRKPQGNDNSIVSQEATPQEQQVSAPVARQ